MSYIHTSLPNELKKDYNKNKNLVILSTITEKQKRDKK